MAKRRTQSGKTWWSKRQSKGARKLLEIKEELLKLEEGFPQSRDEFLESLAEANRRGDKIAQSELAAEFARKWDIPFEDVSAKVDFSFLGRTPFTANPAIELVWPVRRSGSLNAPMLKLTIDVRFEKGLLLELIQSFIDDVEREWKEKNGRKYRDWEREVEKWKRVLQIRRHAVNGMTTPQIAQAIKHRGEHSVIARARSSVGEKGYRRILPFFGFEGYEEHRASTLSHPFNPHAKPPIFARVSRATPEEIALAEEK